jgi:hypothetical protein
MENINDMTRKQFERVPYRDTLRDDIGLVDSLIILPSVDVHDSGYRCMAFIAVRDGKPLCRISGCSDAIHIDGIGGYGYKWLEKYNKIPELVPPSDWSIDCLPKSGLLRLFTRSKIRVGMPLSSFEVYSEEASNKTTKK